MTAAAQIHKAVAETIVGWAEDGLSPLTAIEAAGYRWVSPAAPGWTDVYELMVAAYRRLPACPATVRARPEEPGPERRLPVLRAVAGRGRPPGRTVHTTPIDRRAA